MDRGCSSQSIFAARNRSPTVRNDEVTASCRSSLCFGEGEKPQTHPSTPPSSPLPQLSHYTPSLSLPRHCPQIFGSSAPLSNMSSSTTTFITAPWWHPLQIAHGVRASRGLVLHGKEILQCHAYFSRYERARLWQRRSFLLDILKGWKRRAYGTQIE